MWAGNTASDETAKLMWLRSQLSMEERVELQNMSRSCLSEVMITRGAPMALASIAGLYMARKQGLVRWNRMTSTIIFGTVPVAVAILANGFFLGKHPCTGRIKIYVDQLYSKYSSPEQQEASKKKSPGRSYAELREANRTGRPLEALKPERAQQQQEEEWVGEKRGNDQLGALLYPTKMPDQKGTGGGGGRPPYSGTTNKGSGYKSGGGAQSTFDMNTRARGGSLGEKQSSDSFADYSDIGLILSKPEEYGETPLGEKKRRTTRPEERGGEDRVESWK